MGLDPGQGWGKGAGRSQGRGAKRWSGMGAEEEFWSVGVSVPLLDAGCSCVSGSSSGFVLRGWDGAGRSGGAACSLTESYGSSGSFCSAGTDGTPSGYGGPLASQSDGRRTSAPTLLSGDVKRVKGSEVNHQTGLQGSETNRFVPMSMQRLKVFESHTQTFFFLEIGSIPLTYQSTR